MTAERSATYRRISLLNVAVCVVVSAFLSVHVAHAATVRAGETYELPADTQLSGDLYVLAERALLSGTSTDDVYAAGTFVGVDGVVGADLAAAGGNVRLEGTVVGDARLVAGKVTIVGEIEEDLVVFAGSVVFEDSARIGGDLLIYAEEVQYAGVTVGAAELRGRAVTLNGAFTEDVQVYVSESLGLLDDAALAGDLAYKAPREAFVADGASVSGEIVQTIETHAMPSPATPIVGLFFQVCMYVLGALFVVWLFPAHMRTFTTHAIGRRSGMLALKGFALVFAMPVIAIVLLVTVLGALVGGVLLSGYLTMLASAFLVAPVLVGTILAEWLGKRDEHLRVGWVVLGSVVFSLFTLVPVLGWIVRLLIVCVAFGALITLIFERVWPGRKVGESRSQPTLFDAGSLPHEAPEDTAKYEADDSTEHTART